MNKTQRKLLRENQLQLKRITLRTLNPKKQEDLRLAKGADVSRPTFEFGSCQISTRPPCC